MAQLPIDEVYSTEWLPKWSYSLVPTNGSMVEWKGAIRNHLYRFFLLREVDILDIIIMKPHEINLSNENNNGFSASAQVWILKYFLQ